MKHIGIVGGTFDPIHNGHLTLGKTALEDFSLDEVWFMPTGQPAYKTAEHKISSRKDRGWMTKLAIEEFPWAVFSDLELRRCGNTYTADTLQLLHRLYPQQQACFYYIVGADSLNYMDHWYHPEQIFRCAVILAAIRDTQSLEEMEKKRSSLLQQFPEANIAFLTSPKIPISSTQLRNMAAAGEELSPYVPAAVKDYILRNHLYQERAEEEEGTGHLQGYCKKEGFQQIRQDS